MDEFKNLKVLELAGVLAGPLTGSFFAELGASVTKIENPKTGGDSTRQWKHTGEDSEQSISSYYAACNYGKTVRWMDLSQPDQESELINLILESDILLLNHTQDKLKRFGISYPQLKSLKPSLIIGNISGFPDSDRVAYDLVLQAETGYLELNGTSETGPLKLPVAFIDIFASMQLRSGILAALYRREKNGEGSIVEVSLLEAAISSMANRASAYLMNNFSPGPNSQFHPNIAPYGELFKSSDSIQFLLAVGNDRQFNDLATLLNTSELAIPEFSTNSLRLKNRERLGETLKNFFKGLAWNDLKILFDKKNIPYGKVRKMENVLEENPQLILEEQREGLPTRRVATCAFNLKY